MKLRWLDGLVLLYGILLIAGGLYAYSQPHHSLISLIAGGTCGVLEIGFAALAKTSPRVGRIGSAIVALLVLGQMGPEYFKKGNLSFLVLAVASLVTFFCLLGGHFYAMSKRKANTPAAEKQPKP